MVIKLQDLTSPSSEGASNAVPSSATFGFSRPVSINGTVLSQRDIAREVQNFPGATPQEAWDATVQALAIRELLLQEARRLGLHPPSEPLSEGEVESDEEALLRALIDDQVGVESPSEQALCDFFEANRQRFVSSPLYDVQHILIPLDQDTADSKASARQLAADLASQLLATPERFGELARAHSRCPSAANNGYLGQIGPGDTVPEFEQALGSLAAGEISAPVETRYGLHIILMNHRVEGKELPFESVRDRITAYLEERAFRKACSRYIGTLIGRATIVGVDWPAERAAAEVAQ